MEKSDGSVAIEVVVESVEFSGASYIVYAKLGNSSIRAALSDALNPVRILRSIWTPRACIFLIHRPVDVLAIRL